MALATQATACLPRRESAVNDGVGEFLTLEHQPSHLLNASPEIRNVIYGFAIDHTEPWEPAPHLPDYPEECEVEGSQIAVAGPEWGLAPSLELLENVKPYAEQLWKFFALTQVCQQIRAEYRPIWFRDACIRIRFELLENFYCILSQRLGCQLCTQTSAVLLGTWYE